MPGEAHDSAPKALNRGVQGQPERAAELFGGSVVRSRVGLNRSWLWLPLLATACQAWSDVHTQADWAALQTAVDEQQKVHAARELCQDDTTRVVDQLSRSLGAYVGSDAEAYIAAAVAKARPNGTQWLAQRVYGSALDEAFADLFDADDSVPPRLDWPALADALMIGLPNDPEGDRWLALLAIADDGEVSARVREALGSNGDVRLRVREALDRVDVPRRIPPRTLAALGTPRDEAEATWLKSRYQAAFQRAIEDRPIGDNSEFEELKQDWTEAFPNRELPLPPRDREMMRVLKPLLAPDDAPDVPPSFEEIAAFMTRHNRNGWLRVVEVYAEGQALPSDALSFVCRVSAAECSEVLQSGLVTDIASAADVAPALDLPDGDATLSLACSQLPPDEARQLAGRAAGAGMPLHTRETAAGCLMSLGDDVTSTWRELMPEALQSHNWGDAEMIAVVARDAVGDDARREAMEAIEQGEIRAIDVPWLLMTSDEGAELLKQDILSRDPDALDGLQPGAILPLLAPIAEHLREPSQTARVVSFDVGPID